MLHPDRLFPAEPGTRAIARDLYDRIVDAPLNCPHTHIDPWILADDRPFPDPAALLVTSDHYVLRILTSQGVAPEALGLRRVDGDGRVTGGGQLAEPREVWRTFVAHWPLFRGTPTRLWIQSQLEDIFGERGGLRAEDADGSFDRISELLASPEFRPRALFDRFGIRRLATTDDPARPLTAHEKLHAAGWGDRVVPTFRPDGLVDVSRTAWVAELAELERLTDTDIGALSDFLGALRARRAEFARLGATATDHGPGRPLFRRLPGAEADEIFNRARRGQLEPGDGESFTAHLLCEFADMSADDGLVMQLHPGSTRNHDRRMFQQYGADLGADIPHAVDFVGGLAEVLNDHGNDHRFRLVVFTLDEAALGRELAPLAAHYPALRVGAPWWFFDAPDGMRRHRELVSETAGFYNGAGFNDDARNFVSIPGRHDVARRADCAYLARLVAEYRLEINEAHEVAKLWAVDQAREVYG